MNRNTGISRPLTVLVTLMALGLGGCGGGAPKEPLELCLGDICLLGDETIGQSELRNGESVTNLVPKHPKRFRLLAGGAAYKLNLVGGTLATLIYDDVHPGAYDGRSRYSALYRDDKNGFIGIDFALTLGSGIQHHFVNIFGPDDLDSEQTGPFLSYTEKDSFSQKDMKFSIVEPGEEILGLEYATFGSWSHEPTDGLLQGGFFFSGVPTTDAGMPRSGSATYAGLTIGALIDGNIVYALKGDMALAVNFADGSVDGDFTSMMQTSGDGTVSPWRDFTMAASINAGTDNFSGTTGTNDGLLSGQAKGAFFGPSAAEVAGAWTLSGDGEIALGSFGGGKN